MTIRKKEMNEQTNEVNAWYVNLQTHQQTRIIASLNNNIVIIMKEWRGMRNMYQHASWCPGLQMLSCRPSALHLLMQSSPQKQIVGKAWKCWRSMEMTKHYHLRIEPLLPLPSLVLPPSQLSSWILDPSDVWRPGEILFKIKSPSGSVQPCFRLISVC